MSKRVVVNFLTGFLGSGKTSLLNELLCQNSAAGLGILLNEAGVIDLERHVLTQRHTGAQVVELSNGCLCCVVDRDLEAALDQLLAASTLQLGSAPLDQVIVETSGLADPCAMMETIFQSARLDPRMTIGSIACLVASDFGAEAIDRHPEAQQQVASADFITITRTDLAPLSSALERQLNTLSSAPVLQRSELLRLIAGREVPARTSGSGSSRLRRHSSGISSVALAFGEIPNYTEFSWSVAELMRQPQGRLLRLKAITEFTERPGTPAFVQGVQGSMGLPEWLPEWPSQDRRGRLLATTQNIAVEGVLAAFRRQQPSLITDYSPRSLLKRTLATSLPLWGSPFF